MENKQHFTSLQPKTSLQDCKQQVATTDTTVNLGGVKEVSPQSVKGGRIEYIDALRGFTMILVVMTHVSGWVLDSVNSYSSIMAQFRMPLFFFISGFVFYKNIVWDKSTLISFMRKKIPVQILTPTVFLLLYVYIKNFPIIGVVTDGFRYGYWFTYVLFIFFVFYISTMFICQWLKLRHANKEISLLLTGLFCYIVTPFLGYYVDEKIILLLLVWHWKYFLFFIIGTLVKKHFSYFQQTLDSKNLLLLVVVLYFCLNIFDKYVMGYNIVANIIVEFVCSICGVCLIFAFFRKYSSAFTKEKVLGRALQYVGRRTLDIYLLHYFFMPLGLASVFTFFSDNKLPSLEIFVSLFIALLIICLCLIISNVYRLSPWIEQYMFGVKKKRQ